MIDLYGQCAQVTITSGSGVRAPDNHLTSTAADIDRSVTSPFSTATGTVYFRLINIFYYYSDLLRNINVKFHEKFVIY